tara:strand:- start:602 stop:1630 length:1029 start_codon:yes stop_codon:yes gene_type:complete
MKTKAAILFEQNKPLVIDEVEIPKLVNGQVLVDIHVSRICGSQIGEIDGVKGDDKYLPHLLGHEGGGIIVDIGPEVKTVKPGDHVVLHWRPGLGIDSMTPKYKLGNLTINAGHITTFNEYAVISENRVTKIDKSICFELAALMADTITTGFGLICREANLEIGQSIVIIGIGGIGMGAVLGAHLAGANPIIAVDIYDHKLKVAKEYGATHIINAFDNDIFKEAKNIIKDLPDVIIEGTGIPDSVENALQHTHSKGKCILFGVMHYREKMSFNPLSLFFGKTLVGSEGGRSLPHIDIPRYLDIFKARDIKLDSLISHRCNLDQINNAIDSMRNGKSLHTMIHL